MPIRFLFILLLLGRIAAGQQALRTEQFSVAEGLSDGRVHFILQDRYGLLWIGTATGGVSVYDGYNFRVFKNVPGNPNSILDNMVNGLLEDADGNIWMSTRQGVAKYIRARNHFVNYDFEKIFPENKDLLQQTLSFTQDDSQNIWLSTVGLGMVRYDRRQDTWMMQKYQTPNGVTGGEDLFVIGCSFDQHKRLWVGMDDFGLMWFDDKDQVFKPAIFSDPSVVPDFTKPEHMITCLYTDPTGTLWITARSGIFKYNPDSHEFKILQTYQTQNLNFWTFYNEIVQDRSGNIWVANNLRGVLKFDGISDDFKMIPFAGQNFSKEGISDIQFISLFFDRSGIMWLGTIAHGLLKHDPQRAAFKHYQHEQNNPRSMSSSQVFGLFESLVHPGKIYVGLRGGGLNLFDPEDETFAQIPLPFSNDVFGGSVRAIEEQSDGTMWLGTWGDGLLKLNGNGQVIAHFRSDSSRTDRLPDDLVRTLARDTKGNFWIGTNNGLCYLDIAQNTLQRYTDQTHRLYPQTLLDMVRQKLKLDASSLQIEEVGDDANLSHEFTITRPRPYLIISTGEGSGQSSELDDFGWITDSQGNEVWTGKHGDESFALGGASKNRLTIDIRELKPGNYILHYRSDQSHSFGKWNQDPPTYLDFWGIRIIELDDAAERQRIRSYLDEAQRQIAVEGSNIRSLHVDNQGIVWIGTDTKGLNRLDPVGHTVSNYAADPMRENTVSDNSIQYIYEDDNGMLWLATNGGLNRFDPGTESFTVFTEEDGLPTNYIASILPGENGGLWLSTRNGLSKMVVSSSTGKITFVNYDSDDGLGGTGFIALVAIKSKTGRYYFGGEHGLNIFRPARENEAPPALYISDISLDNVSMFSHKSEIKPDTTLNDLNLLELPYEKNDLTFAYSALHFSNPAKNLYAHILEGYDKEWIYDDKRTATYTNLDPGEYVFSFKGSNRDGVWNESGKSIAIIILPPWWRTTWAYIGYGLIFIGLVFGIDRIQRRRLLAKARERMHMREMEMRTETAELQAKAADAERRALQAENERKTKELEEARSLQLSMLPKELPQLPHLDIAVYMQTATEVGGDYYDFHVALDGTLTVVVGDATGHGMKAGTMVTTAKSLFRSYGPNDDILYSMQEITRCIKEMNFGKLSMCLTMLKIKGNKLQFSTAGMPPSFIFRRDTRVIEEHLIQAVPLGTMERFPYEIKDTSLKPGDTILLITDGLPELKNGSGEMYGYQRVRNRFEDVAEQTPEEIITHFKNDGAAWTDNGEPEDDVTLVVIKVK